MTLKMTAISGSMISQALVAAACAVALPSVTFASCGSAFCSVNSNWTTEGALTEPGSSFDLRYETIKQDQPRAGTDKVAVGQIHHHHDEVSTANRNLLATYNHSFNADWGLSVTVPLADRDHLHIHNHHGAQIDERWNYTELGDIRLQGRYRLPYLGDPLKPVTAGLIFGVKLPTGRIDVANADGDVAERSLQPGSGTTDAIVGAYYHQKLPAQDSSWFAQVQYQQPLNSHQDFKPGHQLSFDAGYRHALGDKLGALLQLNLLAKGRDSGSEAEPADSGGKFISVSPGLSYAVTDKLQLYGFVQLPLYQDVNGVQLTADKSLVVGLSGRF
jgi:hypothetical protein